MRRRNGWAAFLGGVSLANFIVSHVAFVSRLIGTAAGFWLVVGSDLVVLAGVAGAWVYFRSREARIREGSRGEQDGGAK